MQHAVLLRRTGTHKWKDWVELAPGAPLAGLRLAQGLHVSRGIVAGDAIEMGQKFSEHRQVIAPLRAGVEEGAFAIEDLDEAAKLLMGLSLSFAMMHETTEADAYDPSLESFLTTAADVFCNGVKPR